jgi:hypothetical protein
MTNEDKGLGASASPIACSPTAEPPRGVSSASPLRPTGAGEVAWLRAALADIRGLVHTTLANGVPPVFQDALYAAALALVRRAKDTDAIATAGYRHAIEPFLDALEAALPPKPISSQKLIALLDDPRIAAAVNEKGGGRGS